MKRILFVDDEPGILDGLRRMLRAHRTLWDMRFVASGAEALAALDATPFDVLVTDMRMPGMSGAQLLERVQRLHPRTVRIVLSGQADVESCMRSISVSHQFLAKPCDARTLEDVVERACRLEELLRDPRLQTVLGGVVDLPVLPRVYRALTAALADPEADARRIGAIVEQDAALASKILQLVNSSFFGIRREICDLRAATAYLGVDTLRDLVLTFEVFRQLEPGREIAGFSMEREQAHSLLTARIARGLTPDRKAGEQAFLAAMLHDVGKLVLATRMAQPLREILATGAGSRRPFHRVEEELLGVSHAEIGAYLLGLWGMPYPIVEAVAHHHHPGRVRGEAAPGLLATTHVADCLAHEQERGPHADGAGVELDEDYLARLGIAARLPEWRALAATEAERARAAA